MPTSVSLDDEDWNKVMAIIATASWTVANPLLMKIGEQLRAQKDGAGQPQPHDMDIRGKHVGRAS